MPGRKARQACFVLGLALLVGTAGCGNNNGGSSPLPPGTVATGSTGVAVDGLRNLAFVARSDLLSSTTGNGVVDVLNVGVNPNKKDPIVAEIDLGHQDYPTGVAVDPANGRVYVVSGDNNHGGFLDIISDRTMPPKLLTAGAPIPFPAGSDTGSVGQVIFDPKNHDAVVSTTDANTCPSSGTCTGFSVFDLTSKTFGPIIQATPGTTGRDGADAFALNPRTGVIIAPDDDIDPTLIAVDLPTSTRCTLTDSLISAQHDSDASSFDPTTNLVVIGYYNQTSAVIVNLNGSSFTGTPPGCSLDEGGTPPNSVTVDLGAYDPGVAVNPVTHQAFMTGRGSPSQVALVSLPKKAVTQIDSSMVSAVTSTLPNTPDGNNFDAEAYPYYTTVDVLHNRGYIVDDYSNYQWLAQVDLKAFEKNPSGISTALPSGTCGTTVPTSYGCDNGNGVVYFPLPTP